MIKVTQVMQEQPGGSTVRSAILEKAPSVRLMTENTMSTSLRRLRKQNRGTSRR